MTTLVKICGITNVDDAFAAAEAGADLLGFIFYPPSPRSVTPEQARRIADAIRQSPRASKSRLPGGHRGREARENTAPIPISFVGVFVDEELPVLRQIVAHCDLDYAQLHGMESPEVVTALMDGRHRVIKAFRVRAATSLLSLERYQATAYLLDAYVDGQPGGTGRTFDWDLAVRAKRYGPIILGGGLTPNNVAVAVRVVQPWAVDVASGVEGAPGRKDHEKVRRFIAAAKSIARGL
ncbi:MAG TPA: phosphoribosylanthranilate isomerase [Anaerolineae bacterium]|nr:phosphoribosylanthranilate isomerase [Anaerolineae bacterium]